MRQDFALAKRKRSSPREEASAESEEFCGKNTFKESYKVLFEDLFNKRNGSVKRKLFQ